LNASLQLGVHLQESSKRSIAASAAEQKGSSNALTGWRHQFGPERVVKRAMG